MMTFFAPPEVMWTFAPALPLAGSPTASVKSPVEFDHDLDAQVLPRELGRILLGQHFDRLAVDDQIAFLGLDRAVEFSVGRIVFEQVRIGVDVEQVVDRHHFEVLGGAFNHRLEHLPADPAKSVDANFCCHGIPPKSESEMTF